MVTMAFKTTIRKVQVMTTAMPTRTERTEMWTMGVMTECRSIGLKARRGYAESFLEQSLIEQVSRAAGTAHWIIFSHLTCLLRWLDLCVCC